MSDTRELQEKLEQVQAELRQMKAELDKQRTQHTRDQKSLQEDLAGTRREAGKLRVRLEKEEERERERAVVLPAGPDDLEGSGEGSSAAVDTLVALARAPASVEQALPVLSRLLRLSPADVRLRLTASQPSILARLPGLEAEQLRDLLAAEGFAVVCTQMSQLVGVRRAVRRFTLEEQRLVIEDAKRGAHEVPYSQLRLLVRGRRKSVSLEKTVEMEYGRVGPMDKFAMRTPKEDIIKHPKVENFLWVYGGTMPVAFSEATSFVSLGAKQGLTKHSAMQSLLTELRQRAPHALVDERLMGPSLSLPMVGADRSQEVLAGLMDQSIQASLWP